MYYTVYKTTNLINGKIYIGKHVTKNPNDSYLGSGSQIKAAIKKYGINNFKKEVLFVLDSKEQMAAKERELVTEEFCQRSDTYNMHEGGEGGFAHVRQSADYKKWCSKGAKNSTGRMHPNWGKYKFKAGDAATKALSIKANLVKQSQPMSAETRRKISTHQKINNSMSGRCWCVEATAIDYSNRRVFTIDSIPNGWISIKQHRDARKNKAGCYGKFWIHNDKLKQNTYCSGDIPLGWNKGRKLEYCRKQHRSDS